MPWKQRREAGVLIMAHGAAGAIEEIKPYLSNIRGGREPDPNLVQQIIERYRLMGGRSPLLEITQQQALALKQFLHDQGVYFRTYVGMRHWRPTIQEAITQLLEDALDHVVAICLTPYYSRLSVGAYFQKLHEAQKGSGRGFEIIPVESWNDHPLLLQAFAEKIRCALDRFPLPVRDHIPLLFTAHSLPEKILAENDPYPRELLETVEGIVKRLGSVTWRFAY
jgi:ferrochelatase